jgi:hypothetical protein
MEGARPISPARSAVSLADYRLDLPGLAEQVRKLLSVRVDLRQKRVDPRGPSPISTATRVDAPHRQPQRDFRLRIETSDRLHHPRRLSIVRKHDKSTLVA